MADEDRILDELAKDPKGVATLHEAISLNDLSENEGWQYIVKRFSRFKEGAFETLTKRLMAGRNVSQSEIDFTRGYAQAIEDITRCPERVEKSLEHAAHRAYERLQRLSEEDSEDPYL